MTQPALSRRGLILGLGAVIAAPAIVRASSLMAIKPIRVPVPLPPGNYNFIVQGIYNDMMTMMLENGSTLQFRLLHSPKEIIREYPV